MNLTTLCSGVLKQFDRATRLKLSKKRRRYRQRADRRRSRECNNRATRCDACGLRAFVSDSTSHFMKIRSSVLLCWWRLSFSSAVRHVPGESRENIMETPNKIGPAPLRIRTQRQPVGQYFLLLNLLLGQAGP